MFSSNNEYCHNRKPTNIDTRVTRLTNLLINYTIKEKKRQSVDDKVTYLSYSIDHYREYLKRVYLS